jgi:hypothetical protein
VAQQLRLGMDFHANSLPSVGLDFPCPSFFLVQQ